MALLALAAGLATPGHATEPAGNRAVVVLALNAVSTPDGRTVLYSTERAQNCYTNCARLMRSTDDGKTWTRLPARGWTTGRAVTAVQRPAGPLLVSASPEEVVVSTDGGQSFRVAVPHGGIADVHDTASNEVPTLLAGEDGKAWLGTLPGGRLVSKPGSGLLKPRLVLLPGAKPAAVAGGRDPVTKTPVVQRCDLAAPCGASVKISSVDDYPAVFVSPGFARDKTIFVGTTRGGLFRSTDGGATFQVVYVEPRSDAKQFRTVQPVVFTPDFDAKARRGTAYVAVTTVFSDEEGVARMRGGVFASRDGGTTWAKVGGPSPLDSGVTMMTRTPDGRLFAGYIAPPKKGGVLCTRDEVTWQTSCAPRAQAANPTSPTGGSGTAAGQGKGSTGQPATQQPGRTPARSSGGTSGGAGNGAGSGSGSGGGPRQEAVAPVRTPPRTGGPAAVAVLLVVANMMGLAALRRPPRLATDPVVAV